jgi:hypothetical protein
MPGTGSIRPCRNSRRCRRCEAGEPALASQEWCEIVDAALKNPNASPARKEEYIAVGQANHCPHQMFLEPRRRAERPPSSLQQWCDTAFQLFGGPDCRSLFETSYIGEDEKSQVPPLKAVKARWIHRSLPCSRRPDAHFARSKSMRIRSGGCAGGIGANSKAGL